MAVSEPAPPYLSLVVVTRNDDHGGDPLKRLQAFVNAFDAQTRRTLLQTELIVVEWNPPADRPRLHELLKVPIGCLFPIRFIEVPAALHERIPFGHVLPLFQMIGKNVGIRRARGRFVLSTNIDIIFSNELVEYLASGQLAPEYHYRVDRHDIEPDFPIDGVLEDQMEFCRTHQLRIHTRSGTQYVDRVGQLRALDPDIVDSRSVALGGGWHVREGDPEYGFFRWVRPTAQLLVDRTDSTMARCAVLEIDIEPNPYQPDSWVELEILEGDRRLAHRRVAQRGRILVPLDDGVARHDIVLRVLDSNVTRESLPLFERREALCYRVRHAKLAVLPGHVYDMARWKRASGSERLSVEHTSTGVAIASDSARYSYCASYGPFLSPEDAQYEFVLECSRTEGNFGLTVMDDVRQCWLPSDETELGDDTMSWRRVSVQLARGTRFSLFVSNNRPNGDAVSRFVLQRLSGSVPFDQLTYEPEPGRPRTTSIRQVGQLRHVPRRVLRRLKSRASSLALRKARERFESRIVNDSERVRAMEARVRSLSQQDELTFLDRFLREQRPIEVHQNASGDFQLLAREHWFALRGFAEFAMYSMNIDGLFESVAQAAGIEEKVLEMPLCIYHLEHEKGSGWTPEGEALLKQRMAESGITWLDARSVYIWSAYMQWLRRPMIFNGADWGFGDVQLPETVSNDAVKQL